MTTTLDSLLARLQIVKDERATYWEGIRKEYEADPEALAARWMTCGELSFWAAFNAVDEAYKEIAQEIDRANLFYRKAELAHGEYEAYLLKKATEHEDNAHALMMNPGVGGQWLNVVWQDLIIK